MKFPLKQLIKNSVELSLIAQRNWYKRKEIKDFGLFNKENKNDIFSTFEIITNSFSNPTDSAYMGIGFKSQCKGYK